MPAGSDPLVLRNATIITFDDAKPRARAIALRDGIVTAVGTDAEVATPAGGREIDLGGACVIPGFNDTHAHMEREGLKHQRPSLAAASSVSDILDTIRSLAARTPTGQWIITMPVGRPPFYFDGLETLAEKRLPNRHELDAAAPDHPVYIPGVFGNWGKPPGYTALNSRALELNGINSDTSPRCSGVEIAKDRDGQPFFPAKPIQLLVINPEPLPDQQQTQTAVAKPPSL